MRIPSCFVDEIGDFGEFSKHSPYYIITMILHDQNNSIVENVHKLDAELSDLGFNNHVVHTEPLIRREEDYINLSPVFHKQEIPEFTKENPQNYKLIRSYINSTAEIPTMKQRGND